MPVEAGIYGEDDMTKIGIAKMVEYLLYEKEHHEDRYALRLVNSHLDKARSLLAEEKEQSQGEAGLVEEFTPHFQVLVNSSTPGLQQLGKHFLEILSRHNAMKDGKDNI